MSVPASCAEAALCELCSVYGYCIPSAEAEEILANRTDDPDAFVDAVLVAEGLDPFWVDKRARAKVRDVVCEWLFDQGRGRGTKSGLPRFPATT